MKMVIKPITHELSEMQITMRNSLNIYGMSNTTSSRLSMDLRKIAGKHKLHRSQRHSSNLPSLMMPGNGCTEKEQHHEDSITLRLSAFTQWIGHPGRFALPGIAGNWCG